WKNYFIGFLIISSMHRIALAIVVLLIVFIMPVSAQNIEEYKIIVYDDGWVTVNMVFSSEGLDILNVTLLGKPEMITVTDQNYEPLDYDVEMGVNSYFLVVYSFGAEKINITYSTQSLTSKEAEIWNINLESNTTFTVFMPKNSFILEITEIPLSIEEKDEFIVLTMPPGNHTISYTIMPSKDKDQKMQNMLILQLGFFMILIAFISAYFLVKKYRVKKIFEKISEVDRDIIEVLKRKGGKAYQHEIARELEIPKTTLWRHILRLSEEGIVDIKKEGKYNLIILKI
ncbi:MAG: hypothetical protein DRZ80_01260, partial [Thermoprotei archaeon]